MPDPELTQKEKDILLALHSLHVEAGDTKEHIDHSFSWDQIAERIRLLSQSTKAQPKGTA